MGNVNAIEGITEFAKMAERYDFDHFLLSDHYWTPEEPDLLDSWAVLGYLAGVTSGIKLGTCVTPITFRPPLQFAKVVSTLDVVSRGRIVVGVGAGWFEEEFRMFSSWHPNNERLKQFGEALQILNDAWIEGRVTFSGEFYSFDNSIVEPMTVQKPRPSLWFGGWGRQILEMAGRMGDGWVPTGPRSGESVKTPEDYARYLEKINEERTDSGRAETPFAFGCRFGPFENPRDHVAEIEAFRSTGLCNYQLGLSARKHSPSILKEFFDSVISCF